MKIDDNFVILNMVTDLSFKIQNGQMLRCSQRENSGWYSAFHNFCTQPTIPQLSALTPLLLLLQSSKFYFSKSLYSKLGWMP